MPIRAAAVGIEIAAEPFTVTARQCLAYAAALDETADVHLDDARPGGIAAPPAFVVSPEWPVSRDLRTRPEFGATDDERLRAVHAVQDSQFHAPIRPGDRLIARSRLVSVEAIKPGAQTVTKLTLETAAGAPVSTSYSTAIYRGVAVDGADTVAEAPPDWPAAVQPDDWTETAVPVARALPHVYSECANIWNPIHTERAVALAAGLPDIILHGTCTWALAAKEIVAQRLGGDPSRLTRLTGRFTGMVIPGTEIVVRHAAAGDVMQFEVIAADGAHAISDGRALVAGAAA
ncbi:MAG: MaoC/PaaZ C-terminal domain-containing protein [Rhodospirillaceae bacterium]